MQYNAWGVRDIDGYGCIVFEKDPSSVEPEEHGVVAEAVNPPPVEYAWPNGAGIFLEHEAAIAINVTNAPRIVLHVV